MMPAPRQCNLLTGLEGSRARGKETQLQCRKQRPRSHWVPLLLLTPGHCHGLTGHHGDAGCDDSSSRPFLNVLYTDSPCYESSKWQVPYHHELCPCPALQLLVLLSCGACMRAIACASIADQQTGDCNVLPGHRTQKDHTEHRLPASVLTAAQVRRRCHDTGKCK